MLLVSWAPRASLIYINLRLAKLAILDQREEEGFTISDESNAKN
jgi:hypothetical protein